MKFSFLKSKDLQYLLIVVLVLLLVKIIEMMFIYAVVSTNLLDQLSNKWDSIFYIDIAKNGYAAGTLNGDYNFPPVYPLFIRLANFLFDNYLLSATIVANIFSVLAVIAFYFVAKLYMNPENSLYASVSFALFPTFVTYGLVAYSDPVFLFFSILSWYFFATEKYLYSGLTSSLAILSRYISILIPMIFLVLILPRKDIWKSRNIIWFFLPFIVFALMLHYLDVMSSHAWALFEVQKSWGTALVNPIAQFQSFFTGIWSNQGDPVMILLARYLYMLPFLALAYPLWKINKQLTLYSVVFMLFILSIVGSSIASGPRYMLSAWPLILVFGTLKKEYLLPLLVLFLILSFQSTYTQLTSFWT